MTISTLKWTIDLYHQAVAAGVFDDVHVELLHGELVEMSPEGIPHASLTSDAGIIYASAWEIALKSERDIPLPYPTTRNQNPI